MTQRVELPRNRKGKTHSTTIQGVDGNLKIYLTTGENEDGTLGEIFLKAAKTGTVISGLLDSIALLVSHSLQRGVELEAICTALMGLGFQPGGPTNDPDIREARSVSDYIARRLALDYLPAEQAIEMMGRSAARDRNAPWMGYALESAAPGQMVDVALR